MPHSVTTITLFVKLEQHFIVIQTNCRNLNIYLYNRLTDLKLKLGLKMASSREVLVLSMVNRQTDRVSVTTGIRLLAKNI
jgi:hypothetical protein